MSIDYKQTDYSSDVISFAKTFLTLQMDAKSIPILNTIIQSYLGYRQHEQQKGLLPHSQKTQQVIKK